MNVSTDPRLQPDLFVLCIDPRWCLNKKDADDVATDMHKFMEELRFEEPAYDADFEPDADPPRKRKVYAQRDQPKDTIASRRRVSKNMDLRSANPHRNGVSRKKK